MTASRNSARPTSLPVVCDVPGLLLLLFAFFLPLSTSASTVLAFLLALAVCVENRWRQALREAWSNPVGLAILAYVVLHLIGFIWTEDMAHGFWMVKKQWKLLLFPFFLVAGSPKTRDKAPLFFVSGVMCHVVFTTLLWLELIQVAGMGPEHLTRGTFHVVYNPMLALAIYLSAHRLFLHHDRPHGWKRLLLLVLTAIGVWNMFLTIGRTGQVAFFMLTVVFLVQWSRRSRRIVPAVALAVLPLSFLVLYRSMPTFQGRIDQAVHEAVHFRDKTDTSVGMRVHFLLNTLSIIREHPIIGVGTGDFPAAYRLVNRQKTPGVRPTNNSHNQYLLIMAILGLPGLLSLLAIFFLQVRSAIGSTGTRAELQMAFPLFFLTIMLGESYLVIHNTSFLFVLCSALFFRRQEAPDESGRSKTPAAPSKVQEKWLVLTHCFNMDGRAASQTLTDRIPFLLEQGIQPLVVSAPTGEKDLRFPHVQVFSPMPSGILFELRQILKAGVPTQTALRLYKMLLTVLVAPFYLVEILFFPLDSQWSWFLTATVTGLRMNKKYRPKLLYTTGGPPSAHLAGFLVHSLSGLPWLAELYDPLIYDNEPRRYRPYYQWKKWLETLIFRHADGVIFFTETARTRADKRHPHSGAKSFVIRPGAHPPFHDRRPLYQQSSKLRLCHFGSLAPKRNLCAVLQAMEAMAASDPERARHLELHIYGSEPDVVSSECLKLSSLPSSMVRLHGRLERDPASGKSGREQIMEEMARADLLLLIHGSGIMCDEYVPSKTFEYLLAGRPILALAEPGSELEAIVGNSGHVVIGEKKDAIISALSSLHDQWQRNELRPPGHPSPFTVMSAVWRLVSIAAQLDRQQAPVPPLCSASGENRERP